MLTKKSLILSATFSLLAASPCYALDFDSLRNKLLGPSSTVSNLGDQASLKTVIGNRQAQIEQQIEAGSRAGSLTKEEQLELTNQLNHIEFLEGTYLADGNFSETESRNLVEEMSRLSQKLNLYLTNATASGYSDVKPEWNQGRRHHGRGNAYGHWMKQDRNPEDSAAPNQTAVVAMLDSKRAELDSAISKGLLAGTLSTQSAGSLRTELGGIGRLQTQYLADGKISYAEQDKLNQELTGIETRLKAATQPVANNRGRSNNDLRSTTSYRSYLHQRIASALAAGKITKAQADALYARERRVAAIEAQAQQDGWRYTYDEQKRVLEHLDQLASEINAQVGAGWR